MAYPIFQFRAGISSIENNNGSPDMKMRYIKSTCEGIEQAEVHAEMNIIKNSRVVGAFVSIVNEKDLEDPSPMIAQISAQLNRAGKLFIEDKSNKKEKLSNEDMEEVIRLRKELKEEGGRINNSHGIKELKTEIDKAKKQKTI